LVQYFFDTSAFAKYYHTEPGSPRAAEVFAGPGRIIRVSSLGILETQSVFAMKVRMGQLERKAAGVQRAMMMLDIAAGTIEVYRLRAEHFVTAELLIGRHSYTRPRRTLDALQLAVALDLSENGLLDTFVVADKRLAEIAAIEGLTVMNPENQ
jgi:predicted nucleic acid-binding protein